MAHPELTMGTLALSPQTETLPKRAAAFGRRLCRPDYENTHVESGGVVAVGRFFFPRADNQRRFLQY